MNTFRILFLGVVFLSYPTSADQPFDIGPGTDLSDEQMCRIMAKHAANQFSIMLIAEDFTAKKINEIVRGRTWNPEIVEGHIRVIELVEKRRLKAQENYDKWAECMN